MQTGTALGLLVGGAVLLLAVSPPKPVQLDAQGNPIPAQPAPGGALNPFNWFGGGGGNALASRIFGGGAAPAQPGGYQPAQGSPRYSDANWTPAGANTGYQNTGTPAGYSPGGYAGAGIGTPAAFQYPVMTPGGGFQSLQYMSPANTGGMQPASYTTAGYYNSPQTPIYNYA